MKYLQEFRSPQAAQGLLHHIATLGAQLTQSRPGPIRVMEVCGGHTHTIFKYGLEALLPPSVELVHGPGCPVCVMPTGRIDDAIALAQPPDVILATFGDVMRVPGSRQSLLQAKATGADIRIVYSPLDALTLARDHPHRAVVFFAIGFETTAPSTALAVLQAERLGLENFYVFCNHVRVVPALETLLSHPELPLDGFIGPGHVSAIIGLPPYQVIADRYRKPVVVSGFEPADILQSLAMVLRQLTAGRCQVENQYTRLVQPGGNSPALAALARVFAIRQDFEWRGLGSIAASGLRLRSDYAHYDAAVQFSLSPAQASEPKACACGEILQGLKKPWECQVFGTACTPEQPIGACMVSSEGACAAYYRYAGTRGPAPV